MCIAYPMKIESIKKDMAQVCAGSVKASVSILLIKKPKKGDYVLVHAGIAIEKINRARAQEITALMTELGRKIDEEDSK